MGHNTPPLSSGYERPAALTRRKPGKFSLSDSVEVMYNRGR
ncbi:hypothetical protein HOLDEFILI_02676 [Holdemania filiformis DSM 12042]|uniref:Uncharacterized protein n=1 Tax=Holdemania filiformis DSM 12042 TaxID=545696 RepID=B9YA18_9FIRM|nr:hypothetical protein HOLDEFILI_02676 [Holdemania filiformis DSM 12042]